MLCSTPLQERAHLHRNARVPRIDETVTQQSARTDQGIYRWEQTAARKLEIEGDVRVPVVRRDRRRFEAGARQHQIENEQRNGTGANGGTQPSPHRLELRQPCGWYIDHQQDVAPLVTKSLGNAPSGQQRLLAAFGRIGQPSENHRTDIVRAELAQFTQRFEGRGRPALGV